MIAGEKENRWGTSQLDSVSFKVNLLDDLTSVMRSGACHPHLHQMYTNDEIDICPLVCDTNAISV